MVEPEYDGVLDTDVLEPSYSDRPIIPTELTSTAVDLAKSSIERKIQTGHIVNHHGAMQMYIANMSLAKKLGFSDEERSPIVPFPSPTRNTTIIDNGSEGMMAIALKLADVLAAAQKPATTETSKPEQSDTTISEPTPEVKDGFSLRVNTREEKPPVVTPVAAEEADESWSTWIGSHICPIIAGLVLLLGSAGGGAAIMNYFAPGTPATTPIRSEAVDGHIGVTIE